MAPPRQLNYRCTHSSRTLLFTLNRPRSTQDLWVFPGGTTGDIPNSSSNSWGIQEMDLWSPLVGQLVTSQLLGTIRTGICVFSPGRTTGDIPTSWDYQDWDLCVFPWQDNQERPKQSQYFLGLLGQGFMVLPWQDNWDVPSRPNTSWDFQDWDLWFFPGKTTGDIPSSRITSLVFQDSQDIPDRLMNLS